MATSEASLMGRRKNSLPFDKKGGVVVMQRRLIASEAYLRLSSQAKALTHLLQVHWRNDEPIGFGVREAEAKIPCSRRVAMRAFRELEESGFILKVDESIFCSRSQSKARTWRLTWLPWQGREPSNNWEKRRAS